MARRIALVLGMLVLMLAAVFLWPPQRLQQQVVDELLRTVSSTGPYKIAVGKIAGRWWKGLSLDDVRVTCVQFPEPLATVERVRVRWRWQALLNRRIEMTGLDFVHPVFHLPVNERGLPDLPAMPTSSGRLSLALLVKQITVRGGQLVVKREKPPDSSSLHIEAVELAAQLSAQAGTIERLSFRLEEGSARVSGRAGWGKARLVEFHVKTQDFPLEKLLSFAQKLPGPLVLSHTGEWTISHADGAWIVGSAGTLSGAPLTLQARRAAHGPYEADLTLEQASVEKLWLTSLSARWGTISCQIKASGQDFTPGTLVGSLRAQWRIPSDHAATADVATAEIDVSRGAGRFLLSAKSADGRFSSVGRIDLNEPAIKGTYTLALSGLTRLAEYFPVMTHARGQFESSGQFKVNKMERSFEGRSRGRNLSWGNWSLDHLTARHRWNSQKQSRNDLELMVEGLRAGAGPSLWDMRSSRVTLQGHGQNTWRAAWTVRLENELTISGAGLLNHRSPLWQLRWQRLAMQWADEVPWQTAKEGALTWGADSGVAVKNIRLVQADQSIDLRQARYHAGSYEILLAVRQLPLAPWTRRFFPDHAVDGILDLSVDAAGSLQSPGGTVRGRLTHVRYAGTSVQSMDAELRLTPDGLILDPLTLSVAEGQKARATGQIPWDALTGRISRERRPISLHLEAAHWDPASLNVFLPSVHIEPGGAMTLNLEIGGRWPRWTSAGTLAGHVPAIEIRPLGMTVKDVVAQLDIENDSIIIRKLAGTAPHGPVEIVGRSRLPDLHFALSAHDLPLDLDFGLKASADIDVRLTGTLENPHLDGSVLVRDGLYQSPKESVRKKGPQTNTAKPKKPSAIWEQTSMDLGIRWDHNVWYREGLTSIETQGNLALLKKAGTSEPELKGSVTTLRGSYAYYGREFQIQSGQLQFLGPVTASPLLTAQATYAPESTTVYLNVTGTLKNPVLKLRSDPPLSDKDIVSVLVFGRPLSELSSRTGTDSANQEMAKMAGNVLGGYVLKGLRQTGMKELNLDVLNVEPSSQGGRLVVGRYLASNLFVSYGQTFSSQGEKSVTADYYLSHHWTVEASAGSADSEHLDLLFRYPINRGGAPPAGAGPRRNPFHSTLTNPLDLTPAP